MAVNQIGGIVNIDIYSSPVEVAMMVVMANRTKSLDNSLRVYMSTVQMQNKQTAELNEVQRMLNNILSIFGSDESGTIQNITAAKGIDWYVIYQVNVAMKNAGLILFPVSPAGPLDTSWTPYPGGMPLQAIKSQVSAAITNLNNLVTDIGNNQQLTMINLQSTSNKRDEAFNMLTNWLKAVHDSMSRISSNV